jgi:hypothetical protein
VSDQQPEPLHIDLHVAGTQDRTQPVEVECLDAAQRQYRVLYTPGFVEGLAAGDVLQLTGSDGQFRVVARGGNIALKVAVQGPIAARLPHLNSGIEAMGGRLDGSLETAAVWTIPHQAGVFDGIETLMQATLGPDDGWWYGNVHAEDGETPLGWWAK